MQTAIIKKMIEPIRNKMPRYGTEKLHLDIKDKLFVKPQISTLIVR